MNTERRWLIYADGAMEFSKIDSVFLHDLRSTPDPRFSLVISGVATTYPVTQEKLARLHLTRIKNWLACGTGNLVIAGPKKEVVK